MIERYSVSTNERSSDSCTPQGFDTDAPSSKVNRAKFEQ